MASASIGSVATRRARWPRPTAARDVASPTGPARGGQAKQVVFGNDEDGLHSVAFLPTEGRRERIDDTSASTRGKHLPHYLDEECVGSPLRSRSRSRFCSQDRLKPHNEGHLA